MESPKQLKDFCASCKQDLCHGERAILTRDLKFFHFYCYKKKCFIFRFFNPIKSFFLWQDANTVIEELNKSLMESEAQKDHEKDNVKGEDALAGGDNPEFHELAVTTKTDVEMVEGEKSNDCSFEEGNALKSQIDMDELAENLMQIMDEVGEMKNTINVFSVEKENDEKIIKRLKQEVAKYKREIMELKWQNSYLHEKLLTIDSNQSGIS